LRRSSEPTLTAAPGRKATDRARLDALEQVCEQLLKADQPIEAFRVYADALGGFGHLGLVLGEMSLGARLLRRFGEPTDPHAPLTGLDATWRVQLLYERGLFAGALGDLAYAVDCYLNSLDALSQTSRQRAVALRTIAYTQRLQGNLTSALHTLEQSIAVARTSGSRENEVLALALQAALFDDLGESERAEAGFSKLWQEGELRQARRGLWYAEHLLTRCRLEEAVPFTRELIAKSERRGWAGHAAHGRLLLGSMLLESAPDQSQAMLESARGWAAATGEVEMQLRVHELACRVALVRGERVEASTQAKRGRLLAETCGMSLFIPRFSSLEGSKPCLDEA
jgi:tetratricopeptide (TPR) repeat protein